MYEFEAKAHLGDNNLSECLDMVEAMPHTDPNTFETLAGKLLRQFCRVSSKTIALFIIEA